MGNCVLCMHKFGSVSEGKYDSSISLGCELWVKNSCISSLCGTHPSSCKLLMLIRRNTVWWVSDDNALCYLFCILFVHIWSHRE